MEELSRKDRILRTPVPFALNAGLMKPRRGFTPVMGEEETEVSEWLGFVQWQKKCSKKRKASMIKEEDQETL